MSEQCAEAVIAADHPALVGHFPGNPIVPGVVLIDQVLHAVAAVSGALPRLTAIPNLKFVQPLRPGVAFRICWTQDGAKLRFRCESGDVSAALIHVQGVLFCSGDAR